MKKGIALKKYTYLFTRQDISNEQQLVQTAHVALKLGTRLNKNVDPDNLYFTCVGVRNLDALKAVIKILDYADLKYELFIEPDLNEGELTAIAVDPVDEDKRGVLLAFNLLRFR